VSSSRGEHDGALNGPADPSTGAPWLMRSTLWGVNPSPALVTHAVMISVLVVASVGVIAMKVGVDHVRPIPFSAARFAGGALFILVFAAARGHQVFKVPRLKILIPAAVIGVAANSLFFTYALQLSTAVEVSLIVGLAPLVTGLIVMGIARHWPPWRHVVAIPLGFLGLVAVVGPDWSGGHNVVGDLLALGIPITWAMFLIVISAESSSLPASQFAGWIMLVGLAVLLPLAILEALDGRDSWGPALLPIVISAAFSGISYTGYVWCLPRMGATGTAIYGYLQPPIGASAAALILHESFGPYQILGAVIILGAALLANSRQVTPAARPPLSAS
jgi:drug/metabolite transporter (DMT)-like permease